MNPTPVERAVGYLIALHRVMTNLDPDSEKAQIAHKAIRCLPPNHARILLYRYGDDYGCAEIAGIIGWEEHLVRGVVNGGLHAYIGHLKRVGGMKRERILKTTRKSETLRPTGAAACEAPPPKPAPACEPPPPKPAPERERPRQKPSWESHPPRSRNQRPPQTERILTRAGCYRMLGVKLSDPLVLKRKAYLRKIKQHHPDRVFMSGPEVKAFAEHKSRRLNQAWEVVRAEHSSCGLRDEAGTARN